MRLAACWFFLSMSLAAVGHSREPGDKPGHRENDLYQALQHDGLTIAGAHVAFPPPSIDDGDPADAERKALRALAGSDRGVDDLIRDSVTAPQVIKVRDVTAADGTILRVADLWFVVRARLDQIDPARFGGDAAGKPVEAGNMKFSTRLLGDDALKKRRIERVDPDREWYSHATCDLLDRIHVESTDRVRATRSADSWVFASRTDARFDDDPDAPNRWWPYAVATNPQPTGPPRRYAGGASTTRIQRLASVPGALLVEGHFAFAEPRPWFDGAPILRSKISLVAQDQVRRLRRDLAKQQPPPKP